MEVNLYFETKDFNLTSLNKLNTTYFYICFLILKVHLFLHYDKNTRVRIFLRDRISNIYIYIYKMYNFEFYL